MCGISGVFNCPQFTADDVAKMIDTIKYRGPDEQGVVQRGPALLGHARLAVVDPENGTQPMSNEDGTVWVVFNGEIYNFVELREELKAKGHQFKSRCDTEVLVHLWEEEGEAMLARLVGMYAFFIWDDKQQKGMLARDRQGIKPCYVMPIGDGFAFASEIKSILSLPGVEAEIDDVGLNLVHSMNYCPPPRTCYKNISHMAPGTFWRVNAGGKITKETYWDWGDASGQRPVSEEEFAATLDEAILMQMRFDVKGCLFLSGGVDSSIIAAHLKPQWNEDEVLCFGLDCTVPGYGEFEYAKIAAQHSGLTVNPIQYNESLVTDEIKNVLFHADQPHGDFSFLLIRRLCQVAHDAGVIVAFNGDGPDEALSGFVHNQNFLLNHAGGDFPYADYFKTISYFSDAERDAFLSPEFKAVLPDPSSAFQEIMEPFKHLPIIDQLAAYETRILGPGNNLIKTDRMGAGMSIEGRSPFLDHRMSELLMRIPEDQRLADGHSKYFLKKFGLRHYPHDFMFRQKSMPTLPIGEWIKGQLAGWARETLAQLDPGRYQVGAIQAALDEHIAGHKNHTRPLRTLLTTAVWMSQ